MAPMACEVSLTIPCCRCRPAVVITRQVSNPRPITALMLTADGYVQSFHQNGFPATQVFERAGPIADPMYHNSGALSISNYT